LLREKKRSRSSSGDIDYPNLTSVAGRSWI
jgi:hypothetical protein